ncbi:NAD(P)H-dependent oxidoreductase [Nocardiopsis sp. HNM0947]|uniref:NAD(P)H-dependent oxidoreductase n=1 Tax=Nocardiopsis coralli TaxID=2772213 RepID=A0ABR9P9R8_9ACTN|nr:NAD(P)H-dependent oxidoreductase [Nocardiopsis coralli]MBE3000586.1 NAD(P)H-dependent oxidoreductase [Nocardiopsis coralli]
MTDTTRSAHAPGRDTAPLRVAVLIGSVRKDRFGPVPARWITAQLTSRPELDVDLVDPAEYDLPQVLNGNDPGEPLPEPVKALGERLRRADAFVVVTPVYNRSYPASLKTLVDWFDEEWTAKPVGFVSYGGLTGGVQAVEHLRAVFAEFNTVSPREAVLFPNFWEAFDHDGRPVDAGTVSRATDVFADQLLWWARALRRARAESPFPVEGEQ